jgi:predicted O-methyltransferase YrrM
MDAVKDFADGSLDFVYIDGHHGFKYVAEDIWEWHKKVRKGGIVAGHDYFTLNKDPRHPYCNHVKEVVDAYVLAFKIDDLEIMSDSFHSWMFHVK